MDKDYLKQFEAGPPQEAADQTDDKAVTDFHYKIVERIAVLSQNSSGWTLEVNLISYNDKPAKLDIRRFSPNGRMGKGVALTQQEEAALRQLFTER